MQRDLFTPEEPAAPTRRRAVRRRRLRPAARPRLHLRRRRRACATPSPSASASQAPFGRGDKADRRLLRRASARRRPTARSRKSLAVLDDEAAADRQPAAADALDGRLLPVRLGPGAQRRRAGRGPRAGRHARRCTFLEAVPESRAARSRRRADRQADGRAASSCARPARPVELRQLTRLAKCGSGPVEALVDKGLARRVVTARRSVRRQQPTRPTTPSGPIDAQRRPAAASGTPLEPAAAAGRLPRLPAARRHRQRQDGDLPAGHRGGGAPGQGSARPGAGDQPDAADDRSASAAAAARWRCCTATSATPSAAATGGASRRARCRSSSAPAAPSSPRRRKLGLIVIDEEHESTFKQETTPRYHARDVAVMRARLENIPILLGSATPSLESWHNAQRGQYTLLTLPQRVLDRPLPQVGLIDLRHEPPRRGRFRGPERRAGAGHARGARATAAR